MNLSPKHPNNPISAIHLLSTNIAVDEHNHDIFHKSTNEKVLIKAIDIVLADLKSNPSKIMGLYSVCSILKDGKYDLTTNMSVIDGMTNGAECTIKKVDYPVPGLSRPSITWVLFQEEHIGKDYCKVYSHLFNQSIAKHWVPILEVTRQFSRHQIQVFCRQFPLRPCS